MPRAPACRNLRCRPCTRAPRRPRRAAGDAIHDRDQRPVGQKRHDVAREGLRDRDLPLERTRAKRGAGDAEVLAQDQAEVDLGLRAGEQADESDPCPRRRADEILGEVAPTDQLEDDIHAAPAGGGEHLVGELAVLDDHPVGHAERTRALELGRRARRAVGARADGPRDLHRRGPHAAADGVHEHCLARREAGLGHDRVVGGDERLRARGAVRERQVVGHPRQCPRGDHDLLGIGAAAGQAEDAVTRLPARRVIGGVDLAGELHAGDVGRRTGRRGVMPHPLEQVGAVDRGRAHAHQHLAAHALGVGHVGVLENVRAAWLADADRLHAALPAARSARSRIFAIDCW